MSKYYKSINPSINKTFFKIVKDTDFGIGYEYACMYMRNHSNTVSIEAVSGSNTELFNEYYTKEQFLESYDISTEKEYIENTKTVEKLKKEIQELQEKYKL